MADLPITASKTWVPLLVSGSAVLAFVFARPELELSSKNALDLTTVAIMLLPLIQSFVTWMQKSFLKRPMEIVTPLGQANIPIAAGTPAWHSYARWAAIAVGAGLAGMVVYWVL